MRMRVHYERIMYCMFVSKHILTMNNARTV